MNQYVQKTEGSFIEMKYSGVAWKYLEAQEEFGQKQAEDSKRFLLNSSEKEIAEFTGTYLGNRGCFRSGLR